MPCSSAAPCCAGVAQPLIGRGQIEPVAGLEGIQRYCRAIRLHRSFRRSLDEEEIASQAMTIIRVTWLPAYGPLQAGKIGTVRKDSAAELAAGEPEVSSQQQWPTPAPEKFSWQNWLGGICMLVTGQSSERESTRSDYALVDVALGSSLLPCDPRVRLPDSSDGRIFPGIRNSSSSREK